MVPVALENMEPTELSTMMKRFYVEARNLERKPNSPNSMKAIRSGIAGQIFLWFSSKKAVFHYSG